MRKAGPSAAAQLLVLQLMRKKVCSKSGTEAELAHSAPDSRPAALPSTAPAANLDTKYPLYQNAVQSPKGDISWLVKFFRLYVGGRVRRRPAGGPWDCLRALTTLRLRY